MALARRYNDAGADELVFYDITASVEGRGLFTDVLRDVARQIFIPSPWAGQSIRWRISTGCSRRVRTKVSVNSGAIKDPALIGQLRRNTATSVWCSPWTWPAWTANTTCSQRRARGYRSGRTGMGCARRSRGAGEIVLNSIDTDGVKRGFDLEMLEALSKRVSLPIIASGGAGKMEDFKTLFTLPGVDAGLAASIFHFGEVDIGNLKRYLTESGVPVRL